MSGGIAYVLVNGVEKFKKLCNQELVIVESLKDKEEMDFVKKQIEQHFQYTESTIAAEILERWELFKSGFSNSEKI